jgi:pimeloyl-ACP methyl ester carboxylesterase
MTPDVTVRHGFVQANGLRLHHVDFGRIGRPIVLLHGVAGHAWMWHDVARSLSAVGRVVALDMRGHGDSQWSASAEYTTEDHVRDLAVVLEAVGKGQVDLVGLSWGGLVAAAYAVANPDRIRRLAIVDVPPSFTQGETEVMPRPYAFPRHEDALDWEREANPRASERMLQVMARFGTRPGVGGLVRKHDPFFLERWPFRSDDRWEEMGRLQPPTLLVHAEHSLVLTADVAGQMAERIPNARLVHVPASGHLVPVENPGALANELTSFLQDGPR